MTSPILSEPVTLSEPMAWVDVSSAIAMIQIQARDVLKRSNDEYAREKAHLILGYAKKAESSIHRLDPYRGTTQAEFTHEQVPAFRLEKDGER